MSKTKELLSLGYPIMLGQLGFTLLGFIDNIMVGKLGVTALAAISLANSFIFIMLAIGIGFSIMISPMVSKVVAQNDKEEATTLFHNGVLLCFLVGLILYGLIQLAEVVLLNIDQSVEVVSLAIPYLQIVGLSLIPTMLFQAFKQFIDGLSLTKYPMFCIVIANLVNIFLNYALIFGAFGFPELEVYGAGLGTFLSRILMLVLIVFFTIKQKSIRKHIQAIRFDYVKSKSLKSMLRLSSFSSIQILLKIGLFSATIFLSGSLGQIEQAANQIILSISGMLFVCPLGIGVASTILTSKAIGSKNFLDIRAIAKSSFKLIILLEFFFFILLWVGKEFLPALYINDPAVLYVTSGSMLFLAVFHFFDGLETVILGFLKGFEDTKIPVYICLVAYWLFGVVIAYTLSIYMGHQGIWVGMIVGGFLSSGLLYIRYTSFYRTRINISN